MQMRTVTSWLMGCVVAVALFLGGAAIIDCAAFQKAVPYLPPPSAVACVLEEVEQGNEDPAVVSKKCDLITWAIEDVMKLITGAKMAKAHRLAHAGPPDAGAK